MRGKERSTCAGGYCGFCLIGIVIAILILIAQNGQGTVGPLSTDDFGALAYKIALLVFLDRGGADAVPRALHASAHRGAALGRGRRSSWWSATPIASNCATVADRVVAELVPGHVIAHGRTVEVARASAGDFDVARGDQRRARVTWCSIPARAPSCSPATTPRAAGLPIDVLDYTVNIDTANGRTRAAPVTLDRIAIGGLVERSVEALVAQPGQLKMSLLGMSFLNRLQSWQVHGDRLVLQGLSVGPGSVSAPKDFAAATLRGAFHLVECRAISFDARGRSSLCSPP